MNQEKNPKRIPPGAIELMFAGEIILPKCPDKKLINLFRRYEALFEKFANMDREERIINYKFINGLILTSHAKKVKDADLRKELFDKKNEIFLNLANNLQTRKKIVLKYLVSKNFKVFEFCPNCTKTNTEANLERHHWKFCKSCKVDRNYYNILSMHHKFDGGSATLFLSNDLIPKVKNVKTKNKAPLEQFTEEAVFNKYNYSVRNMDAFSINSSIKMFKWLLELKI